MKSNGIAWVGNIYQKLEAFCEEVDGFMSQDKDKYEKNQIRAGCDNVRKFCSGVVQDLLLPSSDCSVKQPVSDLLPPAKLEVIVPTGEVSNPEPLLDRPPDVNYDEACDTLIKKSIPVSVDVTIHNCPEKAGVNDENVSDALTIIADCLVAQPCESLLPVVLVPDNVVEDGMLQSGCDKLTDVTGTVCTCKSHEVTTLVESSDGHKQRIKLVSEASLLPLEIAPTGRFSDFDWEEASKSSNATEQSTETIEEFEDVKLDDDLSDAEMVKNEICFIYRQASKKKSYKKKLQDAFASKLRSKKKQDYEQIAIWYSNTETKQRAGELSSSSMDLGTKRLLTLDSYESDWEIL